MPLGAINAGARLLDPSTIVLCSFSAIGIHLLPAAAVIVSEDGNVTMSDADTTVNPESTLLSAPTSTTSITPTQKKDSDLG